MAFGRQGGRIVDWDPDAYDTAPARPCGLCGEPMMAAQRGVHYTCCKANGGRTPVCNVVKLRKRDGGGKVCGICWKVAE